MKAQTHIKVLIQRHLENGPDESVGETLHTRGNKRGGLLRLPLESGGSTVVKMWRIRNLKERIKSIIYRSNGWREWRMHRRIHQARIQVPEPFGFFRLKRPNGEKFEFLAIEDLGSTERGLPYLKRLIADNDESAVKSFENRLIEITLSLVGLGVVDIDHQLNNFLIDKSDRLLRIDFECARQYWPGVTPKREFAEMIARLLASHIYAVQPDMSRTKQFSERLYRQLNINHQIRARVQSSVNKKLDIQHRKMGVATTINLPS